MEKAVIIDGKSVRFKVTGGTMYRYKAQFGREYIADLIELDKIKDGADAPDINLEILYNICWVMAKTADDSVPPPQQWLDGFEVFPVVAVFGELRELIAANAKIDRKNAAAAGTTIVS